MNFSANIKSVKPQLLYNKPLIDSKRPYYWVAYLMVLVLVILVIIWWHNSDKNSKMLKNKITTAETLAPVSSNQPNPSALALPGQQPITRPLPIQTITDTPTKPVSATGQDQQSSLLLQQLQPQLKPAQSQSPLKLQQPAAKNTTKGKNNKLTD